MPSRTRWTLPTTNDGQPESSMVKGAAPLGDANRAIVAITTSLPHASLGFA